MSSDFNLKSNMIKGIGWVGLSQILRYCLNFVFIAILARLLNVSDFGIMAIVTAILAISLSIGDLGLSAAIVQKKELNKSELSSSFWTCVMVGLAFYIIILNMASAIADFFHKQIINSIITVISMKFIIDSFGIIQDTLLRKELLFKRLAFVEIIESLSFGLVSIALALRGLGVWSLVYGYLLSSLARVIILWIVCPWRPDFSFSLDNLKYLFRFAKNIVGFKATNYLASNVDRIIVGKILGSVALGYYSMAFTISNFAREKLCGIVNRVGFPAFSRIQENQGQLSSAYLKIITYASIIIFPLLSGLIILCPEFVRLVFGAKWSAMVEPLQYLCIAGMLSSITSFVGIIFLVTGHAEIEFRFSLISLFLLIIVLFSGVRFGISGVASGICFQALIMNITGYIFIRRLIKVNLTAYLKAISPAIICSIIMLTFLKLFLVSLRSISAFSNIALLISSAVFGIIIYLLALSLIRRQLIGELVAIFYKKHEATI
jgi:PST family polysaccharide transporter